MRKQWKLIRMLLRMKLSRQMAYRLNFFGSLFIDGSMFALQILTFQAIYANVDTIGGWGRGETLLFIGTFAVINALNMVIYFFGLNTLGYKVKTGELDNYLTKPGNPLFRLSFESVDLGSVPLLIVSVGIVFYAARQLSAPVTFTGVVSYILLTLAMCVLWYDMMLILRTIPFFVISATSVDRLEGALLEMCMKVPGVAFRGVYKLIFMVLLPYGLMGTVPVEAFIGALSPWGLLYSVFIVILFTVFALYLFKVGLRNYKSAGS